MSEIEVGDLIAIDGSQGFDHGCTDYALLRYLGEGEAVVIDASNCTSCWQVRHDQDHVFAEKGKIKEVELSKIVPASDDWHRDVKYQYPASDHFILLPPE